MLQNSEEIQLSPEALAELQKIAHREFGKKLTDREIEEMGIRLLRRKRHPKHI